MFIIGCDILAAVINMSMFRPFVSYPIAMKFRVNLQSPIALILILFFSFVEGGGGGLHFTIQGWVAPLCSIWIVQMLNSVIHRNRGCLL